MRRRHSPPHDDVVDLADDSPGTNVPVRKRPRTSGDVVVLSDSPGSAVGAAANGHAASARAPTAQAVSTSHTSSSSSGSGGVSASGARLNGFITAPRGLSGAQRVPSYDIISGAARGAHLGRVSSTFIPPRHNTDPPPQRRHRHRHRRGRRERERSHRDDEFNAEDQFDPELDPEEYGEEEDEDHEPEGNGFMGLMGIMGGAMMHAMFGHALMPPMPAAGPAAVTAAASTGSHADRLRALSHVNRDFTPEDYEALLELDAEAAREKASRDAEAVETLISRIPIVPMPDVRKPAVPAAAMPRRTSSRGSANDVVVVDDDAAAPTPAASTSGGRLTRGRSLGGNVVSLLESDDEDVPPPPRRGRAAPEVQAPAPSGPNEECAVCRDDMPPRTRVRLLPCLHRFHVDCIDPWLRINASCPICKEKVG